MRGAWTLWIYRSLVTLAFLVAAFENFPAYQGTIALGVLMLSQGLAGIGTALQLTATVQNHLDDAAERKTRHAIILAHDPDWRDDLSFWSEVDRRVALERGPDEPGPGFWGSSGLVFGGILWRLGSDLAKIFIAAAIAS